MPQDSEPLTGTVPPATDPADAARRARARTSQPDGAPAPDGADGLVGSDLAEELFDREPAPRSGAGRSSGGDVAVDVDADADADVDVDADVDADIDAVVAFFDESAGDDVGDLDVSETSVFSDVADLVEEPAPVLVPPAPTRAPRAAPQFDRRERRRRVKLQARRVRRIVRHVEPWSVLKISLVFYLCVWVIVIIAAVLLWSVAVSSGTVDKVESFVTELFGLETFEFDPDKLFRGFALGGLVLVIAGTAFNVLMCVLFNLISDLTGGLRITVIEEESARFRPTRRAPRPRRPVP